ncbi:MAG: ATP-binding protein [archaeon]|nr:ATP-binding protein [archaeon]
MDRPMSIISIGEQDFKEMRDRNEFYVDKTLLVKDIIDRGFRGSFLITRPRRFGKSLAISTLDAFFNQEYAGNTWFEGLEISKHPECLQHMNRYPVVSISLNDLNCNTYDDFIRAFNNMLDIVVSDHMYLLDSENLNEAKKDIYRNIRGENGIRDLSRMDTAYVLKNLVHLIRLHYGTKVVLLMDEYDDPLNLTYGKDHFGMMRGFFRSMLTSLLKNNNDVQIAILTGVMQIAKESVFSGLNNLETDNVLVTGLGERFGFSADEVKAICGYYGHPEKFDEAKEWYDGYRFGGSEVYNPWSVLKYVNTGFVPSDYWVKAGGNSVVARLLDNLDLNGMSELRSIANGDGHEAVVDTSVAYGDLTVDRNALYSVMVMAGYLNAVQVNRGYDKCRLSIPNKEVLLIFSKMLLRNLPKSGLDVTTFLDSVLSDDTVKMTESLENMLYGSVSGRILGNEHSYQSFILGMFMFLSGRYDVTGDYESGDGYHDIRMECLKGGTPHVVVEIKKNSDNGSDIHRLAEEAIEQIHTKRYYHGLKGKVYLYGIAFDGKKPVIVSEVLEQ